jgi:aminobenzoyl-glutamate utilization protein B
MDYMVNMMREHVPQETRIHYIITRGGAAPNIVPDFAEAYYYARQPNMPILDKIWDRIVDTAKGAALGTGTTMDVEVTGAVYNVLPNEYLSGVMNRNLERVGGFSYTPEEAKFAEEIRKTLTDPPDVAVGSQEKIRPMRSGAVMSASTDYADVSWNVPAVSMTGATFAPGVPAHSWQATACAGSTIGVKGMMVAAKSMALTTVDLFTDPSHIQKAKAEFDQKRGPNFVYKTRLADRKPALDYRK